MANEEPRLYGDLQVVVDSHTTGLLPLATWEGLLAE